MSPHHLLPVLAPYQTFLVDIDDTLFDEHDFVRSGFRAVAAHLGGWGIDPEAAWRILHHRFETEGRERILNHLLAELTGDAPPERIQELVHVYREHHPHLEMYPGAEETLAALRAQGRVWVVTDGLAAVQQRKFAALELDQQVDRVIFCDELGCPKPDPGALRDLVEPGARDIVFIGDRPDHDLALAANLGIDSIRVHTGRFRDLPNTPWQPVADLPAFADLLDWDSGHH